MLLIKNTINGKIFQCNKCDAFHIEYKNLNFNFNKRDFAKFVDFFCELDIEECEKLNKTSYFKRKIIIPIGHKNFNLLFNKAELYEFKELITQSTKPKTYFKIINNKELADFQHIN